MLSAEVMVIAVREVFRDSFPVRVATLTVVALVMTALVYGTVGVLVRIDDWGLRLTRSESSARRNLGRGMVRSMSKILSGISIVGTAAMLWVGGHIVIDALDDLGWNVLADGLHSVEEAIQKLEVAPGLLAWLVATAIYAVSALAWGTCLGVAVELGQKLRE